MPEDEELQRRARLALTGPLPEFLGLVLAEPDQPSEGVRLVPAGNVLTALGAPHAAALSAALEIAAYLALLPQLGDDEDAVTHQVSVSYLARADGEEPLIARGEVLRRTRRLAFVATGLRQEERLLATAQVTKSIVGV